MIVRSLPAAALALAAAPALAASPIGNVGTSKVDEGAFSAEVRAGYTFDDVSGRLDNRFRLRQHIDYGFNDWYAVRLVAEQNRFDGGDFDYVGFTFENRFQLVEADRHGFDAGVRAIYVVRDGDDVPDELDFRAMAQGNIGEAWAWRFNSVFEHDVGRNTRDGVALELRSQILRKLDRIPDTLKSVGLGLEMFNDFGRLRDTAGFDRADHQLGPVAKISFRNGAYLQTGYRVGLSEDAPDHLFKLFVGAKF